MGWTGSKDLGEPRTPNTERGWRDTACATPPPPPARKGWREDVAHQADENGTLSTAGPAGPAGLARLRIPLRASSNSAGGLSTPLPTAPLTPSPSRLDNFTPWQEPESEEYLARLFRIAKRQTATPAPDSPCARRGAPPHAMADFLASFNIGGDSSAPIESDKYGSVDELALYLRGLLEQKTTETRAEHVAVTLELRPTVHFHLTLTESENEAFEALSGIDPSMGGIQSASASVDQSGQTTRSVSGNETLMNQSDNPVLQRTVAKHIIGILGMADRSNWTLRDLSRGQQGWNFTYICKDSVQQWNRQNGKAASNSLIAEYSQKEPEEILMNRPAFDCRGSITIAFNRSSRAISIKYDHTLLHKTVQQLNDEYQPPVRDTGAGYQRQQELKKEQQKTKQKSKRAEKRERKRKEREENAAARGEVGERPAKRKKRPSRKKKAKDAQDGAATNPDPSDAQPANGTNQPHATTKAGSAATGVVTFSVTPEEAARREQVARALLSDAGVDPNTLSADQMNIFSNQSPELQRDSVAMLAKYGAERLQIIHPSNKDKTTSSGTPAQSTEGTPSAPTTAKKLAPEAKTSGRKTKPTAKAAAQSEEKGTPSKPPRKMGKSRVACASCKSRKVKCPKERPACSECASHNQPCEYPPQKPRNNKKKSEAVVVEDNDDDEDQNEEEEDQSDVQDLQQQPQAGSYYHGAQHANSSQQEQAHPDMSYSNNMPVADMLTPSGGQLEQSGNDPNYFQSASGLVLPQPPVAQQATTSHASGLVMPQPEPQNMQESHMSASSSRGRVPSPLQRRSSKATAAARRSLPTGLPAAEADLNHPDLSIASPQLSGSSEAVINTSVPDENAAMSSGLAQQAARNQQRSRQSNRRMPTDSPQLNDNMAQPVGNVQQTRQKGSLAQQSPKMLAAMQAQARTSPLHSGHHRADSRQSHRGQSRTPNAEQDPARGYQAPPQSNNLTAASSNSNIGRHPSGRPSANDSNSRIAYEPYSWQQTTAPASSSYPAYDYNRNTATSVSLSNHATMAPSYSSSTSAAPQYSRSSQPQDGNPGYGSTGSYPQNLTGASSLQNFDMRGTAQKRVSSGSTNKQDYSQYGSHQSHEQQMGQPGWNNFNYSGGNQFGSTGSSWL